jgi:hypothetical protein
MDCSTAEGMVNRYINRTLDEKELEAFLKHIKTCSSCYDELETYFIVHEATKQLDEEQEDEEDTLDIKGLLEQDLRRSWANLKKRKFFRRLGGVLVCAAAVMLVTFLIQAMMTAL